MQNHFFKFFITLNLLLIIVSCSSVKQNTDTQKIITLQEFNTQLYRIEANCIANSELNSQSLNFRAKVIIAGNDSVSLTLFGPFGITLGKLFSDSKKFQFYNTMENTIYMGSPTEENIKKATNLSISMNDFLKLFQGKTPFNSTDYKFHSTNNENQIYNRIDNNNFADFAVISNSNKQLIQYQRKEKGDILILNSTFNTYKSVDKIEIPTKINFSMPTVGGKLIIELENFKINSQASLPENFSIPRTAKIIDLDK
jgi:hypothetical protein